MVRLRSFLLVSGIGLIVLLAESSSLLAQSTPEITIRTSGPNDRPVVVVEGLADEDLQRIKAIQSETERQQLIRLYCGSATFPVLGRVFLKDRLLCFEPRFKPDGEFSVQFHLERLRDDVDQPVVKGPMLNEAPTAINPPALVAVYPNHPTLPQNVLRMYLQFDQPMRQGVAYEHIYFLDGDGERIETPFLEIAQELWSPDGTRLTLLFDPGRIKRGLQRHEEWGPPFEIDETYTLVVTTGWHSAKPKPHRSSLKEEFRHTFHVVKPDRGQPAVSRWKVIRPDAESRESLHVRFSEPLDYGMLQHSLNVVSASSGEELPGTVRVGDTGLDWRFQPQSPWPAGDYLLVASPRLEDRSGNSLAKPFETGLANDSDPHDLVTPASTLAFTIPATPRDDPNVVIILADDLGWRDLSCEDSSFYESPNIDRICNEGMRFMQGYAACQVCSPSRAAIMTGKSPARLKITDYIGAPSGTDWKRNTRLLPAFYNRHLPHEDVSIAEAFREAGYKTFFAGKWHLGSEGSHPEDHGFEINIGGHRAGTPPGGFFTPYKNPKMEDGPPGECLPVRLGQETAAFIETHRDQPFFAFLSFYSVHSPIQSTEPLWDKYRRKALDQPRVDSRFIFDRTRPVRQVQDHPLYAGMVESMDEGVGKVLDKLDELDLAENTIVVFTSDNGGVSSGDGNSTSNLPLRGGKGRQWEGGIREPFFIRWPVRIAAGSSSDQPVIGTDLYPTLIDLAGLPARPEQTLDGVSLQPILEGRSLPDRQLKWHYPHYGNQGGEPSSIIRQADWKLIRYLEDGRIELYNLRTDPGEQDNVAADEERLVASMTVQLDAWLKEVGAEFPRPNPDFDAAALEKQLRNIRENRMPAMEKTHQAFHDPNFQPRQGWWEQAIPESVGDQNPR